MPFTGNRNCSGFPDIIVCFHFFMSAFFIQRRTLYLINSRYKTIRYYCSLLLRRFVFRMEEASAKRVTVMNRKGPWEGYRRQSRPLSPSRLPLRARFKERRLGTRQVLLVNQPYFLHLLYCKLFPKETDLTLVGSQNKKRSFSN